VPDLVVFACLVGVIGAAGIMLGMLAARRLEAWDEKRAAAGDSPPTPGDGSAAGGDWDEDGGDTVE
jgi:hypothetical protein